MVTKFDEKSQRRIMKYAMCYKEIYFKEGGEAYAVRVRQDFEYNIFIPEEITAAQLLTDVYIAVTEGIITRDEAIKKQKSILNKTELPEQAA